MQKYDGYIGRTVAETDWQRVDDGRDESGKKPNVVYIVLDDLGFAHLGCYGSTIETPHIDRLAAEGLRYNNFHTTAICSATRACLLTGVNHHAVGVNALVESFTVPGSPNSLGHLSKEYATTAEILKTQGYGAYAVGKWHLSDMSDRTQSGPFDHWPLGRGFDKYYGFLHGMMDQFNPELYRDNSPAYQPKKASEGYHASEDFTDNAIDYVGAHVNAFPDKPFFLYLAYGAMHSPHHAPQEYIEKYKGKFDSGWDEIRRQWYENQKRLGVIPGNAELTARNEFAPAWDSLSADQKKLFARYMEAFAGFLTHTDEQIGRLIEYLRRLEVLDDTIIVFISDNGASAEGGQSGRFNETISMYIRTEEDDIAVGLKNFDLIGTEYAHNHYPLGWANAGNTPFPWYKVFVHSGGVKDPLIIRYPKAIPDPGAVRGQYHHVSDITPTVLDVIGAEKPGAIKGVPQKPFTGTSFKYTLANPDEKTRKRVQYYEILGNRAIWKDGWKAVVNHSFTDSFDDDVWELYHTDADYSEAHNVADAHPKKLRDLQEEWLIEAGKNNVFPMLPGNGIHNPKHRLFNFQLPETRKIFRLITKPFDIGFPNILFAGTFTATAEIDRRGDGVILAYGDRHGGFTLYVKENKLKYVYASGTREWFNLTAHDALPAGKSTVKLQYVRTGIKSAKALLYINGKPQGQLDIPYARNVLISGNATIGGNKFSPVSEEYKVPFTFDGEITKLTVHSAGAHIRTEDEIKRFLIED
jgi:arylsulfatase